MMYLFFQLMNKVDLLPINQKKKKEKKKNNKLSRAHTMPLRMPPM